MKFVPDYSALSPNNIELLPLKIDTARLRAQFEAQVLPLEPVVRSPAFAGWSVQSLDGTYQSGLETGFLPNNGPGNRGPTWRPRTAEEETLPTMQDFARETSICTGYVREILQQLDELGLHPRRTRFLRVAPRSESSWHVDGQPDVYSVRLHIPVITNRNCFFCYEDESFHMAADGNAYLVKVNRRHAVRNASDEFRYHLVANIWDRRGFTRFHRYDPEAGRA